jgi:hypothetical protein
MFNPISLRLGKRKGYQLPPFFFNFAMEVLTSDIGPAGEEKGGTEKEDFILGLFSDHMTENVENLRQLRQFQNEYWILEHVMSFINPRTLMKSVKINCISIDQQ